jgi:hypothetical protein
MLEPSRWEALLLKELDHLQSIVGRCDTFFYLTKQLCLGSCGYLFLQYNDPEKYTYLALVPVAFFAMEVAYRYTYWSNHLLRIREIRNVLIARTSDHLAPDEVYIMIPKKKNYCWRLVMTIKPYDLFFYGLLLSPVLVIAKHCLVLAIVWVVIGILLLIKHRHSESLA